MKVNNKQMIQKMVKISLDPLGIFSDFIGEDVKIDLPVPDYLVPLFKSQSEEKIEVADGREEKGEEDKVLGLLEVADRELKRGNIEGVYAHLDYGIRLSSCGRCVRNMKSIEQKIKEGDLPEARRRLKTLVSLIPVYYEVIEKEGGKLSTELNTTKKVDESCDSCEASKIIEICDWDTRCLDKIIAYIDTQKTKGLKVMSTELISKAKEYRRR